MFLFDPTFAENYANVEKELERVMGRAGAEIIVAGKWDERKLAYEINRRRRGCYVLVFFRAESDRIAGIERDCQLSEPILRILILSAEGVPPEWMEQSIRRQVASRPLEAGPAEEEPKRDDESDESGEPESKGEMEPETVEAGSPGDDNHAPA
jgi:small subunit ribosomal protein S6